jgi:succinyl-CoA synthetase beta subunit
MVIDRATANICLMASKDGGCDIEEVAEKNPDSIKTIFIHKSRGLMPYQIRKLSALLDIKPEWKKAFITTLLGMYRTFIECDASLIEVNPLVIAHDDRILALDAKMLIDDNALFRQPALSELRDSSYVALDGNIGCMVNGAGLAMATMDVIKHVGGSPANFLDVGGSATSERVEEALRIIVSDKKVKAIFVNVFGGIAKCDVIAQGVVKAATSLNLELPLIVRLQGTNVALGREILDKSGLSIIAVENLLEGAQMAVAKAS